VQNDGVGYELIKLKMKRPLVHDSYIVPHINRLTHSGWSSTTCTGVEQLDEVVPGDPAEITESTASCPPSLR